MSSAVVDARSTSEVMGAGSNLCRIDFFKSIFLQWISQAKVLFICQNFSICQNTFLTDYNFIRTKLTNCAYKF